MIPISVCVLAFLTTLWVARRSLVQGLLVMLAVGYLYGLLRANIPSPYSHFIFDSSLAGLYVGQLGVRLSTEERRRSSLLRGWIIALIIWPVLVCFLPFQTFLISMVGLRGNVFFLPLCLFAVRMKREDWFTLALGLASLNILALGFGGAEYVLGVEPFYPHSPVTEIIYASHDVAGYRYFRIPATFTNAHSYAGTMAATLPLLIGAWTRSGLTAARRAVLTGGLGAAVLGLLMANARVYVVAAAIIAIATLLQGGMSKRNRLMCCVGILAAVGIALSNERFQRFTTLTDPSAFTDRIQGSVNRTFWEILIEYPMGNGLGGGGTSVPSFLADQVKKPVAMESEYARILLEEGIIGLTLWGVFMMWVLIGSYAWAPSPWVVARKLTWCFCLVCFLMASIGTGLLTNIPMTALMFLWIGWVMVTPSERNDMAGAQVGLREPQAIYVH